jgi:carbamoyl-phosphate synthase small subunit
MKSGQKNAILSLEDGSEFPGIAFGSETSTQGEVVFSTGMVGYPQSLTDPSYCGQILCLTYPLIGNYGVPDFSRDANGIPLHFESDKIQVSALVVAELCEAPSHYSSKRSLSSWMKSEGIPGITGVDSRALTRRLREAGVMRGKILIEASPLDESETHHTHLVDEVSCDSVIEYKGQPGKPSILLIDCGVKANILRLLLATGSSVTRVPWNYDFRSQACDGILISNGPGDPKACTKTIASLRKILTKDLPVFGICLGNQILALAAGADTYKLPYGHRGQNQPAIEVGTTRCYMTSQNHGYAVREESLPGGWEPWFINGNDGTIEGIKSVKGKFSAVQFHPEGCPGPRDTQYLIEGFVADAALHASKRGKIV